MNSVVLFIDLSFGRRFMIILKFCYKKSLKIPKG